MLDSMTWPIFCRLGDWVIPLAWLLALLTGVVLGALNGLIVWKTGVDAFIVTLGRCSAIAASSSCTTARARPPT
jgi:ribose transport system permease protein